MQARWREKALTTGAPGGTSGGLAEVAEQRQHAVEVLEGRVALRAEGDPLAQLGQDNQVQDDGAGQQGVLRGNTRVITHYYALLPTSFFAIISAKEVA